MASVPIAKENPQDIDNDALGEPNIASGSISDARNSPPESRKASYRISEPYLIPATARSFSIFRISIWDPSKGEWTTFFDRSFRFWLDSAQRFIRIHVVDKPLRPRREAMMRGRPRPSYAYLMWSGSNGGDGASRPFRSFVERDISGPYFIFSIPGPGKFRTMSQSDLEDPNEDSAKAIEIGCRTLASVHHFLNNLNWTETGDIWIRVEPPTFQVDRKQPDFHIPKKRLWPPVQEKINLPLNGDVRFLVPSENINQVPIGRILRKFDAQDHGYFLRTPRKEELEVLKLVNDDSPDTEDASGEAEPLDTDTPGGSPGFYADAVADLDSEDPKDVDEYLDLNNDQGNDAMSNSNISFMYKSERESELEGRLEGLQKEVEQLRKLLEVAIGAEKVVSESLEKVVALFKSKWDR